MHNESQPVDLAAVARERIALAAVVATYPELLTPAANERTAAWLESETTMAKKLDDTAEGETQQLAVRLPANLLAVLDTEVTRLNALAPGLGLTRAHALRGILAAYRPPGVTAAAAAPVGHGKPSGDAKPKASKGTDLAKRYDTAIKSGKHTSNAIAVAIGYKEGRASGASLSRWRHGGTLAADKLEALDAYLTKHGF